MVFITAVLNVRAPTETQGWEWVAFMKVRDNALLPSRTSSISFSKVGLSIADSSGCRKRQVQLLRLVGIQRHFGAGWDYKKTNRAGKSFSHR